MPDYEGRRERLSKLLKKEPARSILISSPSNVTYLTGFSGDSSYLWIDGDTIRLISDPRF